MTTFGDWLRGQRLAARWTLEELAERSGVSTAYIGALERNQPHPQTGNPLTPSRSKVEALASALGADKREALRLTGRTPEYPVEIEDTATGEQVGIEPGAFGDTECLAAAVSQILHKLDVMAEELRELKQQDK